MMSDRYLGDPRACPAGVDRDEAMHLAVEFDAGQCVAAIGLQAAAKIVKVNAAQFRHKPVRKP